MSYESDIEDTEYLIPAPVLTSSDKLFDFGFISFSLAQIIETALVLLLVWGLWKVLFFLPWQLLAAVSIIIVVIAFLFITQPVNGLPGDQWIAYALRYYLLERGQRLITRRGSNPIRLTHFRVRSDTGQVLLNINPNGHQREPDSSIQDATTK